MTYFDHGKINFSLSWCTENVRILTVMVTTVWYRYHSVSVVL